MANCKSFQSLNLERQLNPTSGPWAGVNIPEMAPGSSWNTRGYFRVNNDPGAADCTGQLFFEESIDGMPWQRMSGSEDPNPVKFAEADAAFPNEHKFQRTFTPVIPGLYRLRNRLIYAGDFGDPNEQQYTDQLTASVVAPVSGEPKIRLLWVAFRDVGRVREYALEGGGFTPLWEQAQKWGAEPTARTNSPDGTTVGPLPWVRKGVVRP